MSQHTDRFLDGFWVLFVIAMIAGGIISTLALVVAVIQYWHYTQWGVYALITVLACYLIGLLVEITS